MSFKKKIITVHSPKGGVGKTSFIKQVSYELAKKNFLNGNLRILLIDLDLEFGDICSLFQINPSTNIFCWVAEIQHKLSEGIKDIHYTEMEAKRRFIINVPNLGIDILPAPIKHSSYYDIQAKTIDIIINNIKSFDYDIILIDTGNNAYGYTISSLIQSDIVYLMLTLDITTVKRTLDLLSLFENMNTSSDNFKYIINFCDLDNSNQEYYEIEETLGKNITYQLPYDDNIRKCNNEGKFIDKKSQYFKSIELIIADILKN